jgi:branched-chain amino acid transport system ATP-binding protein
MLEARGLSVSYGQVEALTGADFHVGEGEIVALIGPNGAGKSSALKAASGVLDYYGGHIAAGTIHFGSDPIAGLAPHSLIDRGMAVVAEGRRVFNRLTVLENLEMGGYRLKDKSELKQRIGEMLELFPAIRDRLDQLAGTLSGGEQQMVALGRALISKPKLLLADEPSLGLSPNFVEAIFERLAEISKSGVTVLLAEQNARMALQVSDRAYVFGIGRIELDGRSEELLSSEQVKDVFFGG